MLKDPNFHVVISFLAFAGVVYLYGYRRIAEFLDSRIQVITQSLQDSKTARNFALAQLTEETKALIQVEEEEKEIIESAQKRSEILISNIGQEIEDIISARQKEAGLLMQRMRNAFEYELKDQIADHITQTLIAWIRENSSETIQKQATLQAIGMLSQLKVS